MSEADEMFEELGYKLEKRHYNCNDSDIYIYHIIHKNGFKDYIRFDTATKRVDTCFKTSFSLYELKAINKKVEELGWI